MLAQNLDDIQKEAMPEFNFAGRKIADIISAALPYLFALAGLLLLLSLIFGGFGLLTSAGEPKKIQEAKSKMTNALIGFMIIFVAYWLVKIVGTILGIPAFEGIF